jgi:arabinogalactan oligomer/maltooligosaccharide transport system permease protein
MNKSKKAGILSTLFMGLGQIVINKEYIKGFIFIIIEALVIVKYQFFIKGIKGLITLGTVTGYTQQNIKLNDHSIFMMVDGFITLLILIVVVFVYIANIKDAIIQGYRLDQGYPVETFRKFISRFWYKSFPYIMSTPAIIGIMFFILLPILFGIAIAFTNYSSPNNIPPANLVDWVGLQNIKDMIRLPMWNRTFAGVLSWTLIWALSTTFLNFFAGLFVALFINSKAVKYKKIWRIIYFLPYSVPALISLLVFRNLLNGQFGPINLTLKQLGLIGSYFSLIKGNIGWLSSPLIARFTVLFVSVLLGFPYFMALSTGVMTSIPEELYEAANIDGANGFQKFKNITFPMVFVATAPLLILTFTFNFNNFNAIYFLTEGGPPGVYDPGSAAGTTDILITWIYNLTMDRQNYSIAALMTLLVFIIVGLLAAYSFSRTRAFKEL